MFRHRISEKSAAWAPEGEGPWRAGSGIAAATNTSRPRAKAVLRSMGLSGAELKPPVYMRDTCGRRVLLNRGAMPRAFIGLAVALVVAAGCGSIPALGPTPAGEGISRVSV